MPPLISRIIDRWRCTSTGLRSLDRSFCPRACALPLFHFLSFFSLFSVFLFILCIFSGPTKYFLRGASTLKITCVVSKCDRRGERMSDYCCTAVACMSPSPKNRGGGGREGAVRYSTTFVVVGGNVDSSTTAVNRVLGSRTPLLTAVLPPP